MRSGWTTKCVVAFICTFSTGLAHAQHIRAAETSSFPQRPVRFIVPFTPGSGVDVMARLLGAKLAEPWNQSVVVDNRAGASGTIGSKIAADAAPDGYTILMGNLATHGINPTLFRNLPYDAIKDFAAITQVADVTNVLVAHPSLGTSSVKELVALAKAKPGSINYGSGGAGSGAHLTAELFKSMAGVQLTHVPYKGVGLAMNDLIGGRIQLMFSNLLSALPHVKAGRLKALGVTTKERSPAMPGLPTIAESGLAGYEATNWFGVFAPANTPKEVVLRLNQSIVAVLREPDMKKRLLAQGADPIGSSPEAFAKHVRSEIRRWNAVIKQAGIKAD